MSGSQPPRVPLTMIGRSFYARARVVEPGCSKHLRVGVVDDAAVGAESSSPQSQASGSGLADAVRAEVPIAGATDSGAQALSEAQQADAPGSFKPRPMLSSSSQVAALRSRLVELKRQGIADAAIYGTKADLWQRLVQREALLDEKNRQREAIEERQRQLREGSAP